MFFVVYCTLLLFFCVVCLVASDFSEIKFTQFVSRAYCIYVTCIVRYSPKLVKARFSVIVLKVPLNRQSLYLGNESPITQRYSLNQQVDAASAADMPRTANRCHTGRSQRKAASVQSAAVVQTDRQTRRRRWFVGRRKSFPAIVTCRPRVGRWQAQLPCSSFDFDR